ncbi:hypothetical protein SDC9_104932 [bioreactor metagenome]|uniref:Uncharacterized protein n=1 Tax=bioreactor metagenome TaxID=1076179 RepID=A0A645B4L0_9ZZZZ
MGNCKQCGRSIDGNKDFCCDPCESKWRSQYPDKAKQLDEWNARVAKSQAESNQTAMILRIVYTVLLVGILFSIFRSC